MGASASLLKHHGHDECQNTNPQNQYSPNRISFPLAYELRRRSVEIRLLLSPYKFIVIEHGLFALFRQTRDLGREFIKALLSQGRCHFGVNHVARPFAPFA